MRGRLRVSGFVIEPCTPHGLPVGDRSVPLPPEQTYSHVTLIAHSELGGSLPSSLVNRLSTSAPAALLRELQAMAHTERARVLPPGSWATTAGAPAPAH